MTKAEKKEEEKGVKRKRRRRRRGERRERNGDGQKEDVRDVFLWRPLKSLVKGETWRVFVTFRGRSLGEA